VTDSKDDRKEDDGSAGPRPHGARQGDVVEELASRAKFLRDVHTKVVDAPKHEAPEGTQGAQTKAADDADPA
jgi:hypothetical protein